MIDYLEDLQRIALTALFNPAFLFLLIVLFLAGKYLGKLTKRLSWWKVLLILYFGLFLYTPVRDAGPILGGIFVLGVASNHVGAMFTVLSWASSISDLIWALRYRKAFEDIRRREQEQENQAHEERRQAYAEYDQQSHQRRDWQAEARQHRHKPDDAKTRRSGAGQKEKSKAERKSQGHRTEHQNHMQPPPAQNTIRDKHLQTLGLEPGQNYTAVDIRKAYRRMAKTSHPDVGGSSAKFVMVVNAWEWLRM